MTTAPEIDRDTDKSALASDDDMLAPRNASAPNLQREIAERVEALERPLASAREPRTPC